MSLIPRAAARGATEGGDNRCVVRLSLFEQYMCTLGRWGAYLSYLLTAVSAVAGDHGWSTFFVTIGSSLLGSVLSLEDRR